jgi:hypothetical protein
VVLSFGGPAILYTTQLYSRTRNFAQPNYSGFAFVGRGSLLVKLLLRISIPAEVSKILLPAQWGSCVTILYMVFFPDSFRVEAASGQLLQIWIDIEAAFFIVKHEITISY